YKKTACSCLIIGGSKDIQCNPDDVAEISNIIQGAVESHIIKDMSHILRLEANRPSIFNYASLIKKPIEPQVLEIVYNWIHRETSATSNS
ncbi:MAG: alpha/beta hydrolase, partial [Planctomycetes bacterium]|nr:alpha/beta hydrolase [Planctomycetota bacterium]